MNSKKPKWEVKYEKYLSEEPVSIKIQEMEKNTKDKIEECKKEITKLKNQKVTGNFHTKEEYEKALVAHNEEISKKEKELEEIKDNPDLEKYKNYENNKDKIKNILEYRNTLMTKLETLPKNTVQEVENKKKEMQGRESRITQYEVEIEDIKKQLKTNIPEEDKQILLLALKTKMDSMGILQAEQGKTEREIADLELLGKDSNEKTENKREEYSRKISKCNIIAANLLKGKSLDDIELKVEPEGKKYTKKEKQKTKQIQQQGTKQMQPVSQFEQKHPKLAKIGNFFKGIGNKISGIFKGQGTQNPYDSNVSTQIIKDAKEDILLKDITVKGKAKAFRDRQAEYKKDAADAYAVKYGGRYETQDGATKKKDEGITK